VLTSLEKGLFGSVPLQFFKVGNMPLQFVYSEPYYYNSNFVRNIPLHTLSTCFSDILDQITPIFFLSVSPRQPPQGAPPSPTSTASSGRAARARPAGGDEQGEGCRRCRVPPSASLLWSVKLNDPRSAMRSSDGPADWRAAATTAPPLCPTWPPLLPGPDGGTAVGAEAERRRPRALRRRSARARRPAPPPRCQPSICCCLVTGPELLLLPMAPLLVMLFPRTVWVLHGTRGGARTSRPARTRRGDTHDWGAVGLLTLMNEKREEDEGNLVQNI
jgi:hypothetical protein